MIELKYSDEITNRYQGSEKKKAVTFDGKRYLTKFSDPVRDKNRSIQYINNIYSEYIGCHICESLGVSVQNTVLAEFTFEDGKKRAVCLCEDFTSEDYQLQEFKSKMLSLLELENSDSTELKDVEYGLATYQDSSITDSFWDMFVVDAFIGNPDRHNGNWGVLENTHTGARMFAPIYDCGSSLCCLELDETLERALCDLGEMNQFVLNTYSALRRNGKRIQYSEFLLGGHVPCQKAIERIVPKIDMEKIRTIISNTEGISAIRESFLCELLEKRYERVLCPAYAKSREKNLEEYVPEEELGRGRSR